MELLTLLALLPVGLLLLYIYKKDHDPEPIRTLAITFLWGCATVVPAAAVEILLPGFNSIIDNFLVVAATEEAFKMMVVMFYIWKHKDFDDTFDAIVYSVMASLGFAAIENLVYVFSEGDMQVAIMRAVFSIPGHAVFAIFMGYFIGIAKTHFYYGRSKKQWAYLSAALFSAIAAHGTYDFLIDFAGDHMEIFAIFVVVMDVLAILLVRKASKDDHPMIHDFVNSQNKK